MCERERKTDRRTDRERERMTEREKERQTERERREKRVLCVRVHNIHAVLTREIPVEPTRKLKVM